MYEQDRRFWFYHTITVTFVPFFTYRNGQKRNPHEKLTWIDMPFIKIGSTVGCMEIEKLVAITCGWGNIYTRKLDILEAMKFSNRCRMVKIKSYYYDWVGIWDLKVKWVLVNVDWTVLITTCLFFSLLGKTISVMIVTDKKFKKKIQEKTSKKKHPKKNILRILPFI